jgi:predicted Fe-Mo cluster-binding NifX family protein
MKAAVPSMGADLDSLVAHRFGRCRYFVVVDSETLESEAVKNPNVNANGGSGTQSAQMMADKGVQVVLTSNIGPNAFQTLSFTGVKVMTGAGGTVREAVQQFNSGHLKVAKGATVPGLFGVARESQ